MEKQWFWSDWGVVSRLMVAVGFAVVAGGFMQSALLVIEGGSDNTARLQREVGEVLNYLAPVVADQALVGDYAAIEQILKKQVSRSEVERLWWTDPGNRTLSAEDKSTGSTAPAWFAKAIGIEAPKSSVVNVVAGGVSYGTLHGRMTPVHAENRLWTQFVKQLQIVAATLFLMLQFIWLIFRGNLGTLRELAAGANRFSQGDHAVRIVTKGAPEVRLAADAFNNMATNTEHLLTSLGKSESKNRLLASIVEQSSEAIWTTDFNGLVTSWNAGAAAMFGYTAAEAMSNARQIGMGNQGVEDERIQRLMRLEKFSYDIKANTKSGTLIDIQVAVAPLLDEASRCVGKISVARDVTERNRSEEALRAARATAETANRAKSAFLARMSHEIRTPMNGVLGMAELLLETGLTSTQRKYAETVHRSGSNLLGIINDVLDFSKIEAGKLELEQVDMDLRRTLEDVVDLLAERAHHKGLELVCSIPAGLPLQMKGDPLRMGQILTNLASNAIKFTTAGSVLLSVSCLDESREQVTMRFDVKDTGLGISVEAKNRIFDEFSQADGSTTRKHGGSGLGLAIAKQLVEMMNGSIHVESTLGVGTTFWFTVVFMKQSESRLAVPSAMSTGTLTGVRALLVESSLVRRGVLTEQVSGWGMTTRIAESSEHALELLKQAAVRGVRFDIAVIDLGLLGMEPLELARAIKSEPTIAKIKLVMLTPVGNHAMIREARSAGYDACMVKPVRQSSLFDALVNVMSGETMTDARVHSRVESVAPVSGTGGSVLLVEDNIVNQAVALGMLSNLLGYKVTVANHGREALDACARTSFDLILMDCHMPEMDGFETTREIRKREASTGKHVPVIALTANAMAQDREECLNAGMDDHLGKPFNRRQIQDMLDRWMPRVRQAAPAASAPDATRVPAQADDVLDRRMLDQLSSLQNKDDPDILARVLRLYTYDTPRGMATLAQAISAGDAAGIERAAHTLKSSSASIGAVTISRLFAELQAAGCSGNLDAARELYAKLVPEHDRVQTALNVELTMLSVS